jgi:hypothetical protein
VAVVVFVVFYALGTMLFAPSLPAQEIKANVTVSFEAVPVDKREEIITLQQDVTRYLNTQQFTGKEFKTELLNVAAEKVAWKDEPVEVDVVITITQRRGVRYDAQLLFTAKRNLYGNTGAKTVTFVAFDKTWNFEYRRNSDFTFSLYRFDSFASVLDFYVMIALGMDLDSYYEQGGAQLYRFAQQIWQNGNARPPGSDDQVGWQNVDNAQLGSLSRGALLNELLDVRFDQFRKHMLAYYVNGLDYLSDDRPKALQACYEAVAEMAKFKEKLPGRSTLMQYFFDAKWKEMVELFRKTQYAEKAFAHLKYLDLSHGIQYDNALMGK